jgi:hypothetical protein
MQITEGAGGFAAFWTARSGLRDGQNTMIIKPARCGRWATQGGKNTSMRLPDFSLQVKGLFVAVPQIEHNWTPHRPAPPQT